MKIGSFEVPELRLIPIGIEILEEIYKIKHKERVNSKDIAILLGYKYGTEPQFYRKLKTLIAYGLLEGQGSYQVSNLGETTLYPKSDEQREFTRTKAVMNVKLWEEIYKKHGITPRQDNFWAVLNDITKISPDKAKSIHGKIYKWYTDDMAYVVKSLVDKEEFDTSMGSEGLISTDTNKRLVQGQLIPLQTNALGTLVAQNIGTIEINDKDTLSIAQSYLNVLKKKIEEREAKGDPQLEPEPEPDAGNINGEGDPSNEPDN